MSVHRCRFRDSRPARLPQVVDDRLVTDCTKDAAGKEQCHTGDLDAGPSECDAAPAGPPLFLPNMLAASQVCSGNAFLHKSL